MTRLRVLGTNPTNFTVSGPYRMFAIFRKVPGFARTRRQGWRKASEMSPAIPASGRFALTLMWHIAADQVSELVVAKPVYGTRLQS